MTLRTPTSLINILLTGLLFIASRAYAEPDISLIQRHNLLTNNSLENQSTENSTSVKIRDMLFEESLNQYLSYNISAGVSHTSGIKIHSSVDLKMHSEMTYLQFKMTF